MSERALPPFVVLLVVSDCVAALAYLAAWGVGGLTSALTALVDPTGDVSLAAWYLSGQLFVLAAALGLLAHRSVDRTVKASWLLPVLPAACGVLSFDAIARLHLAFRGKGHHLVLALFGSSAPAFCTSLWALLLVIPFVAAMIGLGYGVRRFIPPETRGKYVLGLVLLAGSTVARDADILFHRPASYVAMASAVDLTALIATALMLWATHDALAIRADGWRGAALR